MAYNRLNEDALTALKVDDTVVVYNHTTARRAKVVRTTATQIIIAVEGVYAVYAERRFGRKHGMEIGGSDSRYYGRAGLFADDGDADAAMERENAIAELSHALGYTSDNIHSLRRAARNGRLSTPEIVEMRDMAKALNERVEQLTNRSEN